MELSVSDFYQQFVFENSPTAAKCKELLPEPRFYADTEAYQQALEEKNNAVYKYNDGLLTYQKLNEVKNRRAKLRNVSSE